MIDLAIGNTHGRYILLPPSSLDDLLQALEKLQSNVLFQFQENQTRLTPIYS
jgi:hypothetical protein